MGIQQGIWGVAVALAVVLASAAGVGLLYLRAAGAASNRPVPAATNAAATPTPQGVVLLNDPLTSNVNGWYVQRGACEFANGGYQVSNNWIRAAPAVRFPDVDISVQVNQIGGSSQAPYGIVLRSGSKGNYYAFHIISESRWDFGKAANGQFTYIRGWSYSSAIRENFLYTTRVTNTLEVRAKGTQFQFLINGVTDGHASDNTFSNGFVGLDAEQDAQVVFNNLLITTIS